MVESGRLLSDCAVIKPHPGFESRPLRHPIFPPHRALRCRRVRVLRVRFSIIAALLAVLCSACVAQTVLQPKEYAALRKKLATRIDYQTLKASPGSYVGKVFEMRGKVSGWSHNEEGYSLIMYGEDGKSILVDAETLPVDSPGSNLIMLVRIGEGCGLSLSDLRLVACAYEAYFPRPEPVVKPPPVAKPQPVAEAAAGEPSTTQKPAESIGTQQLLAAYTRAIKGFNCKLTDKQADTIARSVLAFSAHYKVDPRLVCAVILAESHFRPDATSRCGAAGLGQLMPSTAAGMGVNNAYDPVANIYGSVRYIRGMLDRMSGNKKWEELTWYDLGLALAAYNAGPGAVKKHGGIPPYRETQNYVRRVTQIYKKLCGVS